MNNLKALRKNVTMEKGQCATVLRMYADFRNQFTAACGQADAPMVNVALAYEDAPAGSRALRIFQDLFDASSEPFELNMHNAWKFDFLRIKRLRESAIAETVRADLVIISMSDGSPLPTPVKTWIEASLEQREGDPGALVLLHEANGSGGLNLSPAETYLAGCARHSGMDFFVNRSGAKRALELPAFEATSQPAAFAVIRGLQPAINPKCRSLKLTGLDRKKGIR